MATMTAVGFGSEPRLSMPIMPGNMPRIENGSWMM